MDSRENTLRSIFCFSQKIPEVLLLAYTIFRYVLTIVCKNDILELAKDAEI